MKKLLKVLNPFIFIINNFNYFCHVEGQRHLKYDIDPNSNNSQTTNKYRNYSRYNFDKDIRYF